MDNGMKKQLCVAVLAVAVVSPVWADGAYQDPYQGYNRFMFRVNDTLDRHVMVPVAKGYRKVTPSPVRTGVRNFFNNLRDVVSFGSNVLRLDIEKASTDLVRVGINSTFGLGGLIDIAGAGQMPNNKNTLGDTFASWGWKNSNYFVYPLTGPSTVRDSIGNTILYAYPVQQVVFTDPVARYGAVVLSGVDRREAVLDLTDSLDDAALDRYAYVRDIYMDMRNSQVGNTQASSVEDIDIDSLVPAENDASDDTSAADAAAEFADLPEPVALDAAVMDAPAAELPLAAEVPTSANTLAWTSAHEKYLNYWPVESVQ